MKALGYILIGGVIVSILVFVTSRPSPRPSFGDISLLPNAEQITEYQKILDCANTTYYLYFQSGKLSITTTSPGATTTPVTVCNK